MTGFTVMGWYSLSPMVLRSADFIFDQTSLLLESLGKRSEGLSIYGNLNPDIFALGEKRGFTTLIARCRRGVPRVRRRGTVPPFVIKMG